MDQTVTRALLQTILAVPDIGSGQQILEVDYSTGRTIIDDEWRAMRTGSLVADWDRSLLYVHDAEEPNGITVFSLDTGEWVRTIPTPRRDGPFEFSQGKASMARTGGAIIDPEMRVLRDPAERRAERLDPDPRAREWRQRSRFSAGPGGMALAGLTALTAACASGGGALPLTGAEAEVLVAGLTGVWELDKSSSEMPEWNIRSVGTPIPVENVEQARQEAVRMSEGTMAVLEPILSVAQPWTTLSLRVDEERLVFVSTPGGSLEVPMSGEWIEWTEQVLGRHPIRTRVYRDGDNLALEHRPRAGGQVRSVLEVTDGRLQITIRIRALRRSLAPWVLVYERNEAGGR